MNNTVIKKKELWIVSTDLPNKNFGGAVRTYHIIKNFSTNNYLITLFCCVNHPTSNLEIKLIEKELGIKIVVANYSRFGFAKKIYTALFKRIIPYMEEYKSSNISSLLKNKINEKPPDAILIEQLIGYYPILEAITVIKIKYPSILIAFDEHNVEYQLLESMLKSFRLWKKVIGKYILSNLYNLEKYALKEADIIFTCSNIDRVILSKEVSMEKIFLLQNGVDVDYFKPTSGKGENSILFMGALDYTPNIIGLKYFLRMIYPYIKNKNIVFYIVGRKPPLWLVNIQKQNPNIIITGYVKDVREYINKVDVCICPLINGSGTRLKILEYMSMGKAIVSTSKGAEGIVGIENNKNAIIADKPRKFAEAIDQLLTNKNLVNELGFNARKLAINNYNWKTVVGQAEDVLKKHMR